MGRFFTNLGVPATASLFLLLPFLLMEISHRYQYQEAFPIPLFVLLWLLQVFFMLLLKPVLQGARSGNNRKNLGMLLLSAACLVLIAGLWVGIMADQIPCFLGAQNCD